MLVQSQREPYIALSYQSYQISSNLCNHVYSIWVTGTAVSFIVNDVNRWWLAYILYYSSSYNLSPNLHLVCTHIFPTQLWCLFITTHLTKKLSNAARDLKVSNISGKDYERMRIDMEELQEALNRSQSFFSTISTAVDPNKLAVGTLMSYSQRLSQPVKYTVAYRVKFSFTNSLLSLLLIRKSLVTCTCSFFQWLLSLLQHLLPLWRYENFSCTLVFSSHNYFQFLFIIIFFYS